MVPRFNRSMKTWGLLDDWCQLVQGEVTVDGEPHGYCLEVEFDANCDDQRLLI